MRVFMLNSGEAVIADENNISAIIKERFSEEIGKVVAEKEEEDRYDELRFLSDMDSYENSLYLQDQCLTDAANKLEAIIYDLKAVNRINRQRLIHDLESLEEMLRESND